MTGCTCNLSFFTSENQHSGTACFQCYKCGINFCDCRLLCTEAAAYSRLFYSNLTLGDAQCFGKNTTGVENNLGGCDDVKSAVAVQTSIAAVGFHHALVEGLSVVGALQNHIAAFHYFIHVAIGAFIFSDQITLGVTACIHQCFPVIFGMHQYGVIQCGAEI